MKSDMENREWLNDYMSLKQVNPNNPFTVPDGYFDSLSERIVAVKNLDELKGKGVLEGFTVPENYFEELTDNIQSRIAIGEATGTDMGFTVPEGYFDNLTEQIQSRVFVEEALAETAENFSVPAGYFNQLSENILAKTTRVEEVKANNNGVIRKLFASHAFKYAYCGLFCFGIRWRYFIERINHFGY